MNRSARSRQVSVIYRWYNNAGQVVGSDWLWAGTHVNAAPPLTYGLRPTTNYGCQDATLRKAAAGETFAELNAVSCTDASNCFATGDSYNFTSGVSTTLIERWNGSTWSIVPSPTPAGAALAGFDSVSCASAVGCLAVGTYFHNQVFDAFVARWNGSIWSLVPPPAGNTSLRDVSCVTVTSCFVVGQSLGTALIEHWDNGTWTAIPAALPEEGAPLQASELFGVSCPKHNRCLAVGAFENETGHFTLIERVKGRTAAVVPSANPAGETSTELHGLSCIRGHECFAVGQASFTIIERT
jgi:hypothetical protein